MIMSLGHHPGASFGGTLITISGMDFDPGITAQLAASRWRVTWLNSGSIQIVTPLHAAGLVTLALSNGPGLNDSLPNAFDYKILSRQIHPRRFSR